MGSALFGPRAISNEWEKSTAKAAKRRTAFSEFCSLSTITSNIGPDSIGDCPVMRACCLRSVQGDSQPN
jgi:hypothetical protein